MAIHSFDDYYPTAPPRRASDSFTVTRTPTHDPRFKPGATARLIPALGGRLVRVVDLYRSPDLYQVRALSGGDRAEFVISGHALQPTAPEWRPGDVVVVRFTGTDGPAFTYVRGARDWLVDTGTRKPDAMMTGLYVAGKLTPVLQAGGEPFDAARLA